MHSVHKGPHLEQSSFHFLPIFNMNPNDYNCLYTTLHFLTKQANGAGVDAVITSDQPLWRKANLLMQSEGIHSPLKNTVLILGGFHLYMSFLATMAHIMANSGLRELFEIFVTSNSVPQILSGIR